MMPHTRSGSLIFGLPRPFRRPGPLLRAAFCALLLAPSAPRSAEELPWPIEAERYITSSFGEPRPGRLHFGVDFSSGRTTGKPVYALGNGSITRVATSPFGYGKMLEFTLDDGRTAVYAHLGAYLPAIEDSLAALRVRRHSYEVELDFPPGAYRARGGEMICWSGETGAGPPHLHVELRDPGGNPQNLLGHGLAVPDTILPEIREVAFIPLDRDSAVNGSPLPARYDSAAKEPLHLTGRIGVAAVMEDRSGPALNPLGVYRVELMLDSTPVFSKQYDRISLEQNRSGALDYLPGERLGLRGAFSALFRREGNTLDFYRGGGVIDIPPSAGGAPHTFHITVADYAGNVRTADVPVIFGPGPAPLRRPPSVSGRTPRGKPGLRLRLLHDCAAVILDTPDCPSTPPRLAFSLNGGAETPVRCVPEGETSWVAAVPLPKTGRCALRVTARVSGPSLRESPVSAFWNIHCPSIADSTAIHAPDTRFALHLAPGALYRAAPVMVDTVTVRPPKGLARVSGVYRVTWGDEPVKGPCTAVFHLRREPSPHARIFISGDGHSWHCAGGQKRGQTFTASFKGSGFIGIFTDTTEPDLTVLEPRPGSKSSTPRPVLRVRVSDRGSGIGRADAVNLFIDGVPVYGEYDPEQGEVRYQVRDDLSRGVHRAIAAALDRAGNRAVRNWEFRVK